MKVLILDVWHDLRTKRLWPVAVLMVAGLVAALVFAVTPGSEPPPPPTATGGAGAIDGAGVRLTDEPLAGSSDLDKFHSHNPFAGGPQPVDPEAGGAPDADGSGDAVVDGGPTGAPVSGDVATGEAEPPAEAPTPPSSGGSGASGSSSTPPSDSNSAQVEGDRESRSQPSPQSPRRVVRHVAFEADVKFGPVGETRPYRGLEGLTLLPGARKPMVLFSGVAADGKTGVFTLLRPSLVVKGECFEIDGECAPVLLLERGERQRIVGADGKRYMVHLVDVRRTRVDR